jgi:hypothetical protein
MCLADRIHRAGLPKTLPTRPPLTMKSR